MSFNYNDLLNKSYFTESNSTGKSIPNIINNNMIPCNNLPEFHYQTAFFLNFCTSLYIELKQVEYIFEYNISKFSNLINELKININSNTSSNLSDLNITTNTFTFYYNIFENYSNNPNNLYETSSTFPYYSYDSNIIYTSKPVFGSDPINLNIGSSPTYFNNLGNILNKNFNKNNINNFYFNNKLKEIITEILNQKAENIIGYLLYKKIFYNTILYNIDIQNCIRNNYINNSNINLSTAPVSANPNNEPPISAVDVPSSTVISNIISNIDNNISNLKSISNNTFGNNDYLLEKNKYRNKINSFNKLRDEYSNTLDKLNLSIKLYNNELYNYDKIKKYSTYIIIILIIIMIFTITLSIFPIFRNDTKNAFYIIIFIVLLIITYIYYVNFKYTVLYEKFYGSLTSSCNNFIQYSSTNLNSRNNHKIFYNKIIPKIIDYTNAVNNLFNDLRVNVNTIGNKTYSQDANIIIYNVYLEKKRQLEQNNIKLTNLFNMIEIIKKQISYLFNFVFIIACLCLILLLGLVLYSSIPQLYIHIIILCVILITILMIYFAFAIIQPTRMIANKNYWAITNPTKKTMGKL
jgi:hypothetical protein